MYGKSNLLFGALAGMATSLLVVVALIAFWPAPAPNLPPKPTPVVLATPTATLLPIVSATPLVTPTATVAPFGDE
jgi:hypothetical protein